MSERVLASVLGGGWSLTGDPAWSAVRRVPPRARAPIPGRGGFDAAPAGPIRETTVVGGPLER